MRSFRMIRAFLVVGVVSFSFISLVNAEIPKRGGSLVIGTEKDPHGMDPHKVAGIEGVSIFPQIYDGLLNIDEEGDLIPGLAESMPEQPDPTTYIFTLRKGVKFHHGVDFDARDVKFSFDRLMNKEVSRFWKGYQEMIKSVEVIDPYKIKITLKSLNIAFLDVLGKLPETRIVSRDAGKNITHPSGTGPFKFKEWVKDDRLTLVRNENYWEKGLPYLDQVVYKPFPEPTTRVINLKTGKVDLVHMLPINDAVKLKKDPRMKVIGRSGGLTEEIYFNTTKPPFDNKKVRQAIAFGINRQIIAESVFLGFAEIAYDQFPSWHWAHNPNLNLYPYDPEKAKALLKEAGFSAENPLSFTIQCTNEPIFTDQAVIVQSQLSKIGVKVKVLPLEKSFWYDGLIGRKGRDYVVSLEDTSDDMTELRWVHKPFSGKSPFNFTGYNKERDGKKGAENPEVERLLDEVSRINDKKKRQKMYDDIQRMILDDLPLIRLSYFQNIIGMKDYVKNHKVLTRNTFPLKEVWIEK